MKTVMLPNGKTAHFPETIRPEVMAAAIAKHGGKPQGQPAIMVMHNHEDDKERKDREDRQEAAHGQRHQQTLATMTDHNQKTNAAVGEHTKATVAVAQGVNKGLDALMKAMAKNAIVLEQLGAKVDKLARSSEEIKNLSKNIDALGDKIGQASEALIKVMKSPRKVVHSPKGRPIGMTVEE